MKLAKLAAACGLMFCFIHEALADKTYILATGRRDPRMYAIDLQKALEPRNQGTPNAIVSRSKVALDRLDHRPLGDSANIAISEDRTTAYVVNHHGAIDNDEFTQHGGRGNIAVMNIRKMIDPGNDDTALALERHIDSGHFGAVGVVLLKDMFIIGNAESHLTEDGGNRITFVDRKTGSLRHMVELAVGDRKDPARVCPAFPVPFVSPSGPPSPVAVLSPHPSWGCFPDPNGITVATTRDGKRYLYTANGGTDDISVIDLDMALAGHKTPELARIATEIGPWGIATSPDGRYVVAANRESQKMAFEGNTISLIDVDRDPLAEAGRVLVGTSDKSVQTRPFIPSFTPNGREIIVPNFRANNVSIVNLQRALHSDPLNPDSNAEVARIPLTRADGRPARPKGSAVTSDGRYAVISAGPRVNLVPFQPTGYVYIIDLKTRAVVGTVSGVGNDPYGLAVVNVADN